MRDAAASTAIALRQLGQHHAELAHATPDVGVDATLGTPPRQARGELGLRETSDLFAKERDLVGHPGVAVDPRRHTISPE